jgi:HAD superfamily hydrolase (TIGR01549 family)
MLKAIIFDYNGVLVDDLIFHRDAFLRVAEDLGYSISSQGIWDLISVTPDEKRILFGDISDEQWKDIKARKDIYYFEMIRNGDIMLPDVEEILLHLANSYDLALVSNTARSYFEEVFPSRLAACFKTTLFAGEINPPKPAPEPLYKAMDILGVTQGECCYVGDSTSDAEMTRRAGVIMLGITTGHHSGQALKEAGAEYIVDNLKDLADKIKGYPSL